MSEPVIPESNLKKVYYGTSAERDAFSTSRLGIGNRWETESGNVDLWTGTQWLPVAVNGGEAVNLKSSGPVGIAHNRNIAAAATTHPGDDTTNTATWTTAEGVTEINCTLIAGTAAAIQNDEVCLAVVNAPSAAVALSWLTDAGSASADVEYFVLHYGKENVITTDSTITRLDVLPLNVACRVIVEAA